MYGCGICEQIVGVPPLAGNFELLFSKHATFKGEQDRNRVQHTGEQHVLSTMEKSIPLCSPNKDKKQVVIKDCSLNQNLGIGSGSKASGSDRQGRSCQIIWYISYCSCEALEFCCIVSLRPGS